MDQKSFKRIAQAYEDYFYKIDLDNYIKNFLYLCLCKDEEECSSPTNTNNLTNTQLWTS